MKRLTGHENGEVFSCEEKKLLNSDGVISKDDMYKIMMHLAEKLAEYEDLEEQGRLIRLPCEIRHKIRLPCEIRHKVYMIYQFCDEGAWEIEEHKIRLEDLENIGKTVFLTRQEAEAALEELGKG